MKWWQGLTPKVTLIFVLFAAFLLAGVGLLAYGTGRAALEAATVSDLVSIALEKQAALNDWLNEQRTDLAALAGSPYLLRDVEILAAAPDSAEGRAAYERLVAELHTQADATAAFFSLMILELTNGRVILATDASEEGRFRANQPYFIDGKEGPYLQGVYYSIQLQAPAITASAPLRSADGRLLGVLAGRLNIAGIDAIIGRRTDLRRTIDPYLVNVSGLFVTQPAFISDPAVLQRGTHTNPVRRCLAGNNGVDFDIDYRGEPVISVFRWLGEYRLCLLVEIDQTEAYAPVERLAIALLLIGGLGLLAASILAFGLARRITRPLLVLQAGAIRLGRGELDARLPETFGDEPGVLAREFNAMAAALAEKDRQLRDYAAQLEQKVQERTEALRASEASFRHLFMSNPLPMWVYDRETYAVLDVNDAAVANYGYSREEFLRMGIADIRPAEDVPRLLEDLAQERPPLQFSGEWRHRKKHGEIIVVQIISHTLEFAGRPAVLVVAEDVTERKRAEEERALLLVREQAARAEAEAAQRRLLFLAESSALLASSLDYTTTLKSLARLAVPTLADWCAVDAVDEDGLLSRLAVASVEPLPEAAAHEPDSPPDLMHVLRTGQSELHPDISDSRTPAAAHDAGHFNIPETLTNAHSAMFVPIITRERTLGVVSFVSTGEARHYGAADLALAEELARRAALFIENALLYERAQQLNAELEQRVIERTAKLEAANQELEAFSYSVSHDLRAPLRSIDGFSRLLLEEHAPHLPPEAQRYLHIVRQDAQQMGRLIDDLLTFSRMGRKALATQAVMPAELARQVLEELQGEYAGRQVEIAIGDLPVCQADPALLRQVFVNLLSNALKFTGKRDIAIIEVGCRQENGEHIYFVRDNGVGFDMRYAHKLFGVFQRLHSPEEYDGTGVGLAIVQRIIHRHGGRVWVDAEVDRGATFYFTLKGGSHDG